MIGKIDPETIDSKVEEISKDFIEKGNKTTNSIMGILSLSKKWDNGLMWGHYTNSHKGFCVGFDSNSSYFNEFIDQKEEKSKNVRDVIYSNERYELNVTDVFSQVTIDIFLKKSLDWKYEDEVRVIASLNLRDKVIQKKPYDINLFKVPHNIINEIIMGVRIEDSLKKEISSFCKERNIDLYQAKISKTKFNIEKDNYC